MLSIFGGFLTVGAVMENQVMDLAAFKKLEKMPTKTELIATIARLLNQVWQDPACCCSLLCIAVPCIGVNMASAQRLHVLLMAFGVYLLLIIHVLRCRCQPRLLSASNRFLPRLPLASRLLLMVMTTRMPLYLTFSPRLSQSSRRDFAVLHCDYCYFNSV